MIWCSCGELIAEDLGEGYLVMKDEGRRWMRRRADRVSCPNCNTTFDFRELSGLVSAQARPA